MAPNTNISTLPSFDGWERDPRANYGGHGRKDGRIAPDGTRYMVKYAKRLAGNGGMATMYVNGPIHEYMASHILSILGYQVQETQLGTLGGEVAVACRDFVPEGSALVTFGHFVKRHLDQIRIEKGVGINQLYEILESDPVLSPHAGEFKSLFWDRFIGDALVACPDRGKSSFGYLVAQDGSVQAAPVYNNDRALFPDLFEFVMEEVLDDPKEILKRTYGNPRSALTYYGASADYYSMMASGTCSELTQAVLRTVPRIQAALPDALEFIERCGFLSETRRQFYAVMLAERMRFILKPAYKKCAAWQFGPEDPDRITRCPGFKKYWKGTGQADSLEAIRIRDSVLQKSYHQARK